MQEIVRILRELDKLKSVARKTRPLGLDQCENSAEHSWQPTVMATSLAPIAEKAWLRAKWPRNIPQGLKPRSTLRHFAA
jgi:5'-deoxynucleotidase YfbR-like HD superfamily hydrolase